MKNTFYKAALFGILVFVVINNFVFSPSNILSWDVFGYYLYLPFKFIYNDLGLRNMDVVHSIIEKYNNTATFYQAVQMPEGHYVMKYPMGLSFIYAPFFFIGHLFASFSSFPTDGFSAPYQVSIFIGGILYALLGIWLLSKILRHFFNTKIAILSLILIVFSTNYIVHITMYGQNSMSHNYLFTLYAAIIWLTILWHQTRKMKYAILLGLVCGLTILSRPTEIVCLAIPFFWGITNKETAVEKVKLFWEHKNQIILFGLILIIFGSFQFIYWKVTIQVAI